MVFFQFVYEPIEPNRMRDFLVTFARKGVREVPGSKVRSPRMIRHDMIGLQDVLCMLRLILITSVTSDSYSSLRSGAAD